MIHTYTFEGRNIVIDVASGAIHVVSDDMFSLLNGGEGSDEAKEELKALREEGLLDSVDHSKELLTKFPKKPLIKAMCLHVAHDCNLRCEYCFASTGDFKGSREIMDLETGKKALRFLIEHSGNRKNLEVDFFGGEPLMNFDVVKELVAYGRQIEKEHQKNFRFTMTTNGVLLDDEKIDYLNREMHNVVLSIDGRKSTNDRMRKTITGTSSYDVIVPKFQHFVEKRGDKNHYIRGTFTSFNVDFFEDLMHLRDLGFKELSMEPVVASPEEPYSFKEEDVPKIKEQYELLAKELKKRMGTADDFNFFHYMLDLAGGPCAVKRASGCGAGVEYVAVTPTGDIYPCHQFVGEEEFRIGTLDTGITNPELVKSFLKTSIFDKKACTECWAKYYCSGGCHANAFHFNKDLTVPYDIACELEQKRVEMAVWLAVERSLRDSEVSE
ncbi:thioether cross-link-forming SCIFF peptide maturase [Guggenheimella bovis]